MLASGKLIPGYGHGFPWAWLLATAGSSAILAAVALVGITTPPPGVQPEVVYLVISLFGGAGLVIAFFFFRTLLRRQRFRRVRLLLDPCPAVTGGVLTGSIELPVPYSPVDVYGVSVAAREYTTKRVVSSESWGTDVRVLLEREASLRAEPAADGTRLRFSFVLPDGAPASKDPEDIPANETFEFVHFKWHVHLKADFRGGKYREVFEVPVADSA